MPRIRSVRINGRLIAFLRDKRGLTQEALAQKAEVSKRLIGLLEAENSKTSHETLDAIVKSLGVPKSLLLQFYMPEDEFEAAWQLCQPPIIEDRKFPIPFSIHLVGDLTAIPKDKHKEFAEYIKGLFAFLDDAVALTIKEGSVVITFRGYIHTLMGALEDYFANVGINPIIFKLTFQDFPDAAGFVRWGIVQGDESPFDVKILLANLPSAKSPLGEYHQIRINKFDDKYEFTPRIYIATGQDGIRYWVIETTPTKAMSDIYQDIVATFLGETPYLAMQTSNS